MLVVQMLRCVVESFRASTKYQICRVVIQHPSPNLYMGLRVDVVGVGSQKLPEAVALVYIQQRSTERHL
jgi:hypothetical protein